MPSRDLQHSITPVSSIVSTAGAAAINGNSVDTQFYESVTIIATIHARTDGTWAFSVQDADESSPGSGVPGTFASLSNAQYIGQAGPPAGAVAVGKQSFGLLDCRRFVRVVATPTGATTGATVSADVILGHPRHRQAAV